MTLSAPPRPPAPARPAPDSKPLDREEIEALVEALIEEARRETRRRHRQYWALAALVSFVGVVVLILLDGGAASQPASPALSARSSLPAQAVGPKIAYISEPQDGGYCGTVWVMNADGTGQRRLANGGVPGCGQEWGHAWSPDGRIAIVSNSGIYVFNADGSGERRLTSGGTPAWSPDGREIAFVRETDGVHVAYVVNADGSDERRLTSIAADSLSWSPDGSQIVFTHGTRNSSEIYVVNADGGGQRRLTRITESNFVPFLSPAWSPDGKRIALVRSGQVWVMNAAGSGQRRLTLEGGPNFNPSWSPDGRRIVFERGGRRQRTNYSPGSAGYEVYVMNADGSAQQRLTRGGSGPRWSPDGRQIVYVSKRGGERDIWIMNADGGGQRNLTPGSGRRESSPLWPPK
jgi:TolB protein